MMTVVAAAALTSCSDKGYWEPYVIEETQYSFAQATSSYDLTAADDMTEALVTVYRSNKNGAVTLPLNITIADSTVLSVANTTVTFADGEDAVNIPVGVDMSAMNVGTKYTATLAFAVDSLNFFPENASISGPQSHTMTVVLNYNWISAGSGVYASGWTGEQFGCKFEKVEGYSDENGYQLYRIADVYAKGYHIEFYLDAAGNAVTLPLAQIPLGITDGGAAVSIYNDYVNYAQYCSFVNEGNYYVINSLYRVGSSLYVAQEQFLWQVGWPGEAAE